MRRLLSAFAAFALIPAAAHAGQAQPGSYVHVAGDHWVTFEVVRSEGRTVLRDVRGYQHSRVDRVAANETTSFRWHAAVLGDDGPAAGYVRYSLTRPDGVACDSGELPWTSECRDAGASRH